MSSNRPDDKANDVPETLIDVKNDTTYKRLRYFGKVSTVSEIDNFIYILNIVYTCICLIWFNYLEK